MLSSPVFSILLMSKCAFLWQFGQENSISMVSFDYLSPFLSYEGIKLDLGVPYIVRIFNPNEVIMCLHILIFHGELEFGVYIGLGHLQTPLLPVSPICRYFFNSFLKNNILKCEIINFCQRILILLEILRQNHAFSLNSDSYIGRYHRIESIFLMFWS